ncbi:phage portal protein [Cryobacterium sp. PH31-AA6]|uniref:phage portal protein n=1 Tax=Cryobacterium sp. PH31-AA6 TaxID=3046205 RepID=UPI0024BB97A5|nr:phage portal protein [Cryobacterium sp. PH31-AA6]MDJ0323178.1 phage portal protein [Cryobacterium sp. PH31-AA6]
MADAVWPPTPFDLAAVRFSEHDAWWSGDMETLQKIYSGTGAQSATHLHNGKPYRGGVVGSLSKMWIGQPLVEGEARRKAHFGMPAVLARVSAALLFAEAPKIRYGKPADAPTIEGQKWVHPGQARLDVIMGSDETHAELLKSGEYSSALGGAYLAVTWNAALRQHVRIRAYASDCAIPEFQDGILTGVTLWTEYEHGRDIFRLLERHDRGLVSFTLHKGGTKILGEVVPMNTLTETAHYNRLRTDAEMTMALEFPALWNESVVVATGVDELAVVYFPNELPQTDWRKLGVLANLGRSDFAGNEERFDNIDQVWSSLLRDIDNGAGRLTVPESYLEAGAPGTGGTFDGGRQVYSGINALGSSSDSLGSQITISQFEIRVTEHLAAIDAIKREIANKCGLSPQHLGLKAESGGKTATEVVADFSDSELTRDKKALYVKPALARLAQVALAIDGVVFPAMGGKFYDELPDIEFAAVSQIDPEKIARTIGLLDIARAISTRQRVKDAHRDWDDEEVDEEVALIMAENGMGPAADPTLITS